VGISGTFATPLATELLTSATLVLAFGASLNYYTTYLGDIFGKARVVHIDNQASALGRYQQIDIAIQADARLAAAELADELDRRDIASSASAPRRPRGASPNRIPSASDSSIAAQLRAWIRVRSCARSIACFPKSARSWWTSVTSWTSPSRICPYRIRAHSCGRSNTPPWAPASAPPWAQRWHILMG
jgi:hypothetical protein